MNPPSAWAVAKRDNPKVAEDCWTFATPKGPKGRYAPGLPFFWSIWKLSPNKAAAKSLLAHLLTRAVGRALRGGERRLRPSRVPEAARL